MADDITFEAILDTGNFDAGMEVMTGALRELGSLAVDALLSAGAAVADFVGSSFAGAIEAEQGFARLTAQLEAQGDQAAITADQAAELADEYSHLAGGSDDAIIAAEAVLAKFTQIGGETFPAAIVASADLAALMGTDVATAAQQLGFALDTGGEGLARIAKQTGAFTEEELKQIEAMRESGDIAGAQALILANLEDAIGGTAQTLAETTAGQWTIFTETIADAGESIAASFLPVLNDLMQTVLIPLIPVIQLVAEQFGYFFEALLAGDTSGAFDALYEGFDILSTAFPALSGYINAAQESFAGIWNFIITNWPILQATFETVFTAIQGVMQVVGDFVTLTLLPAIAGIWEQSGAQLPTAQATFESVMAGIVTATQMVSDFITLVLVPILTMAVDWVVSNWPAIQATIETVWAVVESVFQAIGNFITTFLIPVFLSAVDWVSTNWPTIQATIESVMAAVMAVITTVLNTVIPFIVDQFNQIKSWVDTNWPLIQATIETVINAISAVITSVISAVTAFWTANQNTIMSVASAIWANIQASIENAILLIEGIITTVMQVITGDWEGAWNTVKETAGAIWENIQTATGESINAVLTVITSVLASLLTQWSTAWNSAYTSVVSIAANILSYLTGVVGSIAEAFNVPWGDIGTAIISGISGGISNAVGGLVSSAVSAAQSAYNAAAAALGIGSPSKLFTEMGENTMKSFGAAIDKTSRLPAQAAQFAAQRVITPVSNAVKGIVNNNKVTKTDARQFVLNATTAKPMQTVQAEFSTMQVIASLPG